MTTMSPDVHSPAGTQHLFSAPCTQPQPIDRERAERLGYRTIDEISYCEIIAAGFEPRRALDAWEIA